MCAKRPRLFSYFRATCGFVSVICLKTNGSHNTDGAWLNLSFSFNQKENNCNLFSEQKRAFLYLGWDASDRSALYFNSFIHLPIHKSFIYHSISLSRSSPPWDCFVIEIAPEDHMPLILSHSFPASASHENSNYTCRLFGSLWRAVLHAVCARKVFALVEMCFNQEEDAKSDRRRRDPWTHQLRACQ